MIRVFASFLQTHLYFEVAKFYYCCGFPFFPFLYVRMCGLMNYLTTFCIYELTFTVPNYHTSKMKNKTFGTSFFGETKILLLLKVILIHVFKLHGKSLIDKGFHHHE